MRQYTENANDLVLDLLESDMDAIWNDIKSMPQDTPADLWKKKLLKIGSEFSMSSRFSLMRILCSRAQGKRTPSENGIDYEAFEKQIDGKKYQFHDITLSHANSLTPEEHLEYMRFLLDLADRQQDSDPKVNQHILSRVWFDETSANAVAEYRLAGQEELGKREKKQILTKFRKENKQQFSAPLTRDEALQMGHILNFSIYEMQWFLLRTLDVAEGFRYNVSADIIEAYGFQTGASWQHVQKLKNEYLKECASLEKTRDFDWGRSWTRRIPEKLSENVETWKLHPETMDAEFLAWMKTKAHGLDVPSDTAGRIYRNLAAYAYDLVTGEEAVPAETQLEDRIQDVCRETEESESAQRRFYTDGALCESRCKAVANDLFLQNKVQAASSESAKAHAWHMLLMQENGTLSPSGGMLNSSKTRVKDILLNKIQPEKADMLYLIWFVANLVWLNSDAPDTDTICCRIFDLMDISEYVLKKALLPEFYVPHPIEQSMLLSIVCGKDEDDTPSVVYEYILSTLKRKNAKSPGAKKHDEAFKIEAVTYYRMHPEVTLQECADIYQVSPKSISAWQKKLHEEGKI